MQTDYVTFKAFRKIASGYFRYLNKSTQYLN